MFNKTLEYFPNMNLPQCPVAVLTGFSILRFLISKFLLLGGYCIPKLMII